MGTATGKILREQGATLALLYAPFEASRKDQIVEETYGSSPSGISTFECDITSAKSVQHAFEAISKGAEASGAATPSILVNAAGFVATSPLEDTPLEDTEMTFNANLLGPLLLSQAFAKLYWKHTSSAQPPVPGRIVSISSQAAHVALPEHAAYCASKAGLNALTRSMASEWGGRGITSNTVSPTVALTTLGKKAWADAKKRDDMLKQIPVGRFAEPNEIAEAIVFLCQDSSGMINGADVRLDGGFTIQ